MCYVFSSSLSFVDYSSVLQHLVRHNSSVRFGEMWDNRYNCLYQTGNVPLCCDRPRISNWYIMYFKYLFYLNSNIQTMLSVWWFDCLYRQLNDVCTKHFRSEVGKVCDGTNYICDTLFGKITIIWLRILWTLQNLWSLRPLSSLISVNVTSRNGTLDTLKSTALWVETFSPLFCRFHMYSVTCFMLFFIHDLGVQNSIYSNISI